MGVIPCAIYGIACCKCFLLVGVGCGWYFTVMAARINGKEAESLFPSKECYQVVDLLTGYNSKNWPALVVELTCSDC